MGFEQLPSDFERKVVKALICEHKIANAKIVVGGATGTGDNFIGNVIRVKIEGDNKTLNLIYKIATREGRDLLLHLYHRESFVYDEVIPSFIEIQDKENLPEHEKVHFVKCHKTLKEEFHEGIIVEDLSIEGYRIIERLKPLDWSHMQLILKSLAELHGLSYVLKRKDPKRFAFLCSQTRDGYFLENLDLTSTFLMKNGMADVNFEKAIRAVNNPKWAESIAHMSKNRVELVNYAVDPDTAGDTSVICHGDTWVNNYLFKYDTDGNPIDLRLIDWQLTRHSSPHTDLFYLITNSTNGEFRRKYHEQMYEFYHSSLGNFLKSFSMDVEEIYPKRKFLDDRKKFAMFGFFWGVFTMPFVTMGADDSMVISLHDLLDKEKSKAFLEDRKNETYLRNINDLLRDFTEYGYI